MNEISHIGLVSPSKTPSFFEMIGLGNEEQIQKIQEKIGGKRLFFIEDNYDTIDLYCYTLKILGVSSIQVFKNLEEAVNQMELFQNQAKLEEVDFILIDLFLPGSVPRQLAKYEKKCRMNGTNQGQLFGLYLNDYFPQIGKMYLSHYTERIEEENNQFPECWDKSTPPGEFLKKLSEKLSEKSSPKLN